MSVHLSNGWTSIHPAESQLSIETGHGGNSESKPSGKLKAHFRFLYAFAEAISF